MLPTRERDVRHHRNKSFQFTALSSKDQVTHPWALHFTMTVTPMMQQLPSTHNWCSQTVVWLCEPELKHRHINWLKFPTFTSAQHTKKCISTSFLASFFSFSQKVTSKHLLEQLVEASFVSFVASCLQAAAADDTSQRTQPTDPPENTKREDGQRQPGHARHVSPPERWPTPASPRPPTREDRLPTRLGDASGDPLSQPRRRIHLGSHNRGSRHHKSHAFLKRSLTSRLMEDWCTFRQYG